MLPASWNPQNHGRTAEVRNPHKKGLFPSSDTDLGNLEKCGNSLMNCGLLSWDLTVQKW